MTTHPRVAIVTGVSREIGAAMAETLAASGCAVLGAYYGEAERVHPLVERVRAAGGQISAIEADLSSVAANQELVGRAIAEYGRLDILAANAGLTIAAPFLETRERDWDTLIDLNLKGSYFGAQAAARQMIAQGGGGRIIFSSSVTGMQACQNLSAYGITKAALRHMAKVIALELAPHRITVNAIAIGAVLNDRNLADDPDYQAHWDAITPLGRVGQPQDIANALQFLASEQASWVTGHTLLVDGGWTMRSPLP
jgi:NAD(P)-dependent dehydrogenase (short-subunit alcohol dehydrogenase family)